MLSYTSYMAQRLFEMHRVLKDTGSIYLHCDPTASHYLKLIMDAIFGEKELSRMRLFGGIVSGNRSYRKNAFGKESTILSSILYEVKRYIFYVHTFNIQKERISDCANK